MSGCLPGAIVIDTETTGFGKQDRIVEIAAISLAPGTWETVDEYDTLLNPGRDMGPVGVHGISASMVELAPAFADVVAAIARRMHGKVPIAHNLAFDRRMLRQEFGRLGIEMCADNGLCTLGATRQKLTRVCEERGIDLGSQHRALTDARATAELARQLWGQAGAPDAEPVRIGHVPFPPRQHTMRRGLADEGTSPMHRTVSNAHYPQCDEAVCSYLDALDWVLDDAVIDDQEREGLRELAAGLGISGEQLERAHREYLGCIISAALRDGTVSEAERAIITRVAGQLGLHDAAIPPAAPAGAPVTLVPGMRVCFTGEAAVDGRCLERAELRRMAASKGFVPVDTVTKRGCDLLVASDPSSASGKARSARKFGVPIMSAANFITGHA